jgi:ATP-dependent DNA helicase RecQ
MHRTTKTQLQKIAKTKFGFERLKLGQEQAVLALLDHRDTLVVQPTGSGKSAIYQIAGLLIDGPTIVVSPLIALQKDQVDSIQKLDLPEAAVVNSQQRVGAVREAFEKFEQNGLEYLFLAPEQLQRPETLARLKENPPSLFVVDEAHCISEWGHDFRPDYLRIGGIIESLGHPTILALTATAAPLVRDEIMARLGMRDPVVVVRGFDRPNILLRVETFATEADKREAILARVSDAPKPGIVYVATRKHAEEIADALGDAGVNATAYHGGMPAKERNEIQRSFMAGETEVMVATNAFGMGVDKNDVRFVYHFDIPDSIDSYYQEIGRCGRDENPAEAILFYRPEDLRIPKFLKGGGKLEEQKIRQVGEALRSAGAPVDIETLQDITDLSERQLEKAVNRLEEAGAVEVLPTGETALADESLDITAAAREAAEHDVKHRAYDAMRLEKMKAYAELLSCRREYLLNYFGDKEVTCPCGGCDNCERPPDRPAVEACSRDRSTDLRKLPERSKPDVPFPLHSRVEHPQLGKGVVQKYEMDKIDILFDNEGSKTLSLRYILEHGLLQSI